MDTQEKYLIIMNAGDEYFFLGKHGEYTHDIDEAMFFGDILDAKIYVEKHGLERISSVRKIVR